MNSPLERFFRFIRERILVVSMAIVSVTALCVWGASHAHLDGDLSRLLPDSARSVQGLNRLEGAYADQIGRLTIVLDAPDTETGRQIADRLEERLAELPGVDRVEAHDPASHLRDLRFLYIDADDLATVEKRLEKRIRWEKARANPFFADLGDDPPEVDLRDIEEKYRTELPSRDYYEGAPGQVLVFVRPDFPASNLDATKQLVGEIRNSVEDLLARDFPESGFDLTGRYVKRIEQQEIMLADIGKATAIALVLLTLFLLLYLRSFLSAVQVIAPLVIGTLAAVAFTALLIGSFNVLTGFLAAILLGLGVDYGIHLVTRFHHVRVREQPVEALMETFRTTGRANLFAGLTTMAALGSMAVSEFRAFFEFGIIAVIGLACVLLSYAVVFPTLVFLSERFAGPPRASLATVLSGLFAAWQAAADPDRRAVRRKRLGRLGAALVLVMLAVAVTGTGNVRLDESSKNVTITDTPAWHLDQEVNEILGQSQTPAVVLVRDEAQARRVVEALRERMDANPGLLARVISKADLIPHEQERKREILTELRRKIAEVPEGRRSERIETFDREVSVALDALPLEFSDLPHALRKPFSRKDVEEGSVVLVMPGVDLNDASATRHFAELLKNLPGPSESSGPVDAISDAILMAEIIDYVKRDTAWMMGLTVVGLILITLLAFGPRRDAWILFGTLAIALASALGAMGLAGVDFDFLNLLILPIWLGLAVDASYHLIMHIRERPGEIAAHVSTAVSVTAAFLTSMIGFGSLLVAHHQGMQSIAKAALLGLTAILLVNLGVAAFLVSRRDAPPAGDLPEVAE